VVFQQLSVKFMEFYLIGTIIVLTIYLFLIYTNNSSIPNNPSIPNLEIIKIDVGQGDDIWILTTNHTVMYKFIFLSEKF
jgi:hypothetical protein